MVPGLVIVAYALVYLRSLSFVYVEGDDAYIVAYHAMGRIPELQQVYSPYQSMFDAVLAFLPPRESIVRVTAMALTAFSAPCLFFLMMALAFEWVPQVGSKERVLFAAAMLFAVPELLYLAMVLTPSVVAMALLVGAHLLVRRCTRSGVRTSWPGCIASAAVFGLGASCRWDTVVYGVTIVADLLLAPGAPQVDFRNTLTKRLGVSAVWGLLAGASWLLFLQMNGWSVPDIVRVVSTNGPVEDLDWRLGLARAQTFFTPAAILLIGTGFFLLVQRRDPLALILTVSALAVARFIPYGVPKWFITMMPSMIASAFVGFAFLMQRRWQRWILISLLFLPWVVGVQLSYAGSAWGPRFELQPYDRVPHETGLPSLTIGPGAVTPTPEGPRPLFGHAWVLLDKWKPFVNEWAEEQEAAVIAAVGNGVPLLLPDDRGWPVDTYLSLGYSTHDPQDRAVEDELLFERRWTARDGEQSLMIGLSTPDRLFEPGVVEHLRRVAGDRVVVIAFSSTLARLYELAPSALEPLGKRAAFLQLEQLCARLDCRN